MISGYTTNGYVDEVLMMFSTMLRDHRACFPNHATLVSTLPACVQASAIQAGFWIHSYIVKLYIVKSGMKLDVAFSSDSFQYMQIVVE